MKPKVGIKCGYGWMGSTFYWSLCSCKGKKAKMFKLNKQPKGVSLTRGQWVKWEGEILIY